MSSLILENPESFKHIIRIFNTNMDGKRKIIFALVGIRGIGRRFAGVMCKIARIDPN